MKEGPGVAGKGSVSAGSIAKAERIWGENRTGNPGSLMTFHRLPLQRPPFQRSRRRIIKK
jgi:hypothetical protein